MAVVRFADAIHPQTRSRERVVVLFTCTPSASLALLVGLRFRQPDLHRQLPPLPPDALGRLPPQGGRPRQLREVVCCPPPPPAVAQLLEVMAADRNSGASAGHAGVEKDNGGVPSADYRHRTESRWQWGARLGASENDGGWDYCGGRGWQARTEPLREPERRAVRPRIRVRPIARRGDGRLYVRRQHERARQHLSWFKYFKRYRSGA
jgi:hypothetical protein